VVGSITAMLSNGDVLSGHPRCLFDGSFLVEIKDVHTLAMKAYSGGRRR